MDKIFVSATVFPKDGSEQAVGDILLGVVPKVRAEDGCIRYDLHRAAGKTPRYLFYEIWRDDEALAAHSRSGHMKAMRETLEGLLEQPTEVATWRALDTAPGQGR